MLTSRRTAPEDIYIEHASTRLHELPEDDEPPTAESVAFGKALKARRKELKLSIRELAPDAGVRATRFKRMESGRAHVDDIRQVIARLVDVKPAVTIVSEVVVPPSASGESAGCDGSKVTTLRRVK